MREEQDAIGRRSSLTTETMTAETISTSTFRTRAIRLWNCLVRLGRREPRRLRLCESLPLGERRFVAVVEFEAARFLVGGTPSSLVLLSRLEDAGQPPEGEQMESAPWKTLKTPVLKTPMRIRPAEKC